VQSQLSDLELVSSSFAGGNQMTTSEGLLTAAVYENLGGVPGARVGTLTLTGTLSITYLGRSAPGQLGTFTSLLTEFDFAGTFNGHMLVSRLDLSRGDSSGITTVSALPGSNQFLVDSFFDVFTELSLDGGPFVPNPERHVVLESVVPEAGSAGLVLLGLSGAMAVAWKARRLSQSGPG
jgi:hypothetical protein